MSRIGIDMLDVGKGDAYVVELYNDDDEKFVFVIDGGTKEKSSAMISHVQSYHNGQVNLAICTHPDTDHIGGLIELLQNCTVNDLILNDPRAVVDESTLIQRAKNNFSSDKVAIFKSAFERMDDLLAHAENQGTNHYSNIFSSANRILFWGGWNLYILGPSESLFMDLWLNEDTVRDWFKSDLLLIPLGSKSASLDDPSIDTQPVNNTSIILLIEGYGKKYLFTGDAGKRALRDAMTVKDISRLNWFDVPHHGSRRNLDTEIIDHLCPEVAFISSPGSLKHPRRAVIKALQKTGANVYSTCKHSHIYHNIGLSRAGWNHIDAWETI